MKRLTILGLTFLSILMLTVMASTNPSTSVVYGDDGVEGSEENTQIIEEARANQKALDESELDQQIIAALRDGATADEIKQMVYEYETERLGRPYDGVIHVVSNRFPAEPGVINHGSMTIEEAEQLDIEMGFREAPEKTEQLDQETSSTDAMLGTSSSTKWINALCPYGAYQWFRVNQASSATAKLYGSGIVLSNMTLGCPL